MKKHIALVTLTVLLAVPTQLFAWGQEGHRIVAEIAYRNMSCHTRHKVDKVLGKHGIVYMANWPDEIKSDTIYPLSHDDHFQDLDAGLSDSVVVSYMTNYPSKGGDLFRATDSLRALLREQPNNHDALVFLVHFAGDRFCPMHMGHIEDLGGNRVKMKWFGSNTSLHTVWDSKLIDSQGYSYTEYAQFLMDKYGSERKRVKAMSEDEIVLNNYHLTSSIYDYFQNEFDGNSWHYIYRYHDAMEWQLYVAGIRLAKWLDEIY